MSPNNRQMLCTCLAVLAPLAHFTGAGYMAVLLAAGAMLPLTILAGDGLSRMSKAECALEMIWLGLVMGSMLSASGANWPGEKSEFVVPLVILVMAAWTGGYEKSERASAALFWLAAVPLAVLTAVLIGRAELNWLTPEAGTWSGNLIAALLLPALNGVRKETGGKTAVTVGLIAVLLAAIIQGGLGKNAAQVQASPLYETGRCAGKGGIEILISVILTLSWYGFASFVMRTTECFGEKLGIGGMESRIGVAVIAGIMIFTECAVREWALISGCVILWILLPMLHPKNKMKKDEKRC